MSRSLLIARRDYAGTDITVSGSGYTPATAQQVHQLNVEIEACGRYLLIYRTVVNVATGTAFNEINTFFRIDGAYLPTRHNHVVQNSVVQGRFTVDMRNTVVLSEGTHAIEACAWSFGSNGSIINGSYFMDAQRMEVYKL